MNQRILLVVINVFIFTLLVYVGFVWARPMIVTGDLIGVAIVFFVVSAIWHVVKGEGF